ncbi:transposable element Tcb2 transposase [Trichonephila clavipes]|nr:transposable element Tcb2 transposase [Trichonephila clavipes]
MPGKRARRHFSQLSECERGLIIGMKPAGWSMRRVAGQVDHSECAVRNCWEQWKTGFGATRKTTRREDRRIVRQALVDPTVTRSTIRADVGVAIVPQTISRHLAEANLKSKRPFRELPLTPEHRQLRLQWYQARSMWNVTDWQKVVFSDESRFVLGTDDNRVRVWRRPAYDSRSTLIVIRGTLTGQRYVDDILRPHVGPFLNGSSGAIFQQDNARPHTARVSQDFLRHFQTLPWPTRSPDLSPVEHVWDQLKWQMPSCHSVHDLEFAFQDLRQIYRPISKRNRRTTAQQVANQFLAASGKQISRKTVARRLRGGGLYARRPVCVPLTRQHRTARLQWCREHHNWTEQDWACVLYSDESRFSLSSDCRRQLIWRESGIAYRPENIQEKDRYPTCSIMVWAGIMINGRTRLHVVANGTMTGQRYIDEVLLPHVRLFRGAVEDKFVFMDDNATCHRTLAVQDCLDSEGIQRLYGQRVLQI